MKAKVLEILKFIVGWPLSLIALFFIARLIAPRISEVSHAIKTINIPVLLLSIPCFLGYYLIRTILWHEIIKQKKIQIPLKETVYLWSISEINRYVPGNIWSFLSRSVRFGEKHMSKKDITTSLVQETMFVLVGAVVVSLFSFPYLTTLPYAKPIFTILPLQAVVWLVIIGLILFIFQKHLLVLLQKPFRMLSLLSSYTPQENIRFTLLSTGSLFFFGFGYYFSIASVVPVPAHDFFTLSSFAVVSLLIGYLSLLTPTGLGVREGVLTLGLTQIVSLALAGFSAIFARLVLILSEVLFLLCASLWVRLKNRYILLLESKVKNNPVKTLLILCVIAFALYFSLASFLRFDNFYTGRFDLGNMVQTVWNTSQGRLFLFTHPNSTEIISRLAFHADFILILFAPLYLILPHPYVLLFVQAVIVGSGAFFLYGIANHLLKNNITSFLIAASYLLSPSVQRATLYDFHAVVLATTFLLACWYFYLKKKYIYLLLFLILAGISKEQIWAITALLGLYMVVSKLSTLWRKKSPLRLVVVSHGFLYGISIFVISSLLLYVMIWQFIPLARGGDEHFALEFYGEFGSKPSDLILSLFFEPGRVFQTVFSGERLDYLKQLFLPVGYAPIFFPIILLFTLPDFLINLLSSNQNFHQIYYQYTATITPFLFIASVYAIWLVKKSIKRLPVVLLGVYFFGMAVYGAYLYGPLPGSKRPNLAMFDKPLQNKEEIISFLRTIPKDMKVAATNNAGSHLSDREHIYTIPVGLDQADILVFLVDPHPRRDEEQKKHIVWYMNNPNFVLIKQLDNFYVFRRNRYLTTYF